MSAAEQQLDSLRLRYPGATLRQLPSGAELVTLPGVALQEGWSLRGTALRFLAPAGYPYAAPDCFWADEPLRLANGLMPQNSAVTPVPETAESGLWFSWHLSHPWNAGTHTLSTWTACMLDRLWPAR